MRYNYRNITTLCILALAGTLYTTCLAIIYYPAPSLAEAYRCHGATYTNKPASYSECQAIQSSVICSGDGNKFVAPGKPGLKPIVDSCATTAEHTSPFVDLKSVKKVRAQRKRRSQENEGAVTKDQSSEINKKLGDLGPVEAAKMLECATDAFFGSGDPAKCVPEL